jgi:peptidoglycan/LPS O-acetylase OafA/YrhL
MVRALAVVLIVVAGPVSVARAQNATDPDSHHALWAVSGAGVGFGAGLWVGLSAFDDAVYSDRKVWTSAIVGAGVGAIAGYLIGRARGDRHRPSAATALAAGARPNANDRALLEQLAKPIRLRRVS